MPNYIIQTCRVCGHEQAGAIRQQLSNGQPLDEVARQYQLHPLDLWRCRLHHLEDSFQLYNFLDASADKARVLDAARIHPLILSQVHQDAQ